MSATSIDTFLVRTLRSIRAGRTGDWPGTDIAVDVADDPLRAIWGRIEYHGIATFLQSHLSLLPDWPERITDRITDEARLISLWEATHGAAISDLIGRLCENELESVVLKGTALAYWLYDDPAARRRGDTDLLIHPRDLKAVRAILTREGWSRRGGSHGINYQENWQKITAGGFEHSVDLHWAVTDSPVLWGVLDRDDCFVHSCPLSRLHPMALRPDAAFMAMHAAINRKWHALHGYRAEDGKVMGSYRLVWSVDFDLLAREMTDADWHRLVALCRENETGPLIAEPLRAAQVDLQTPLPEARMEQLEDHEMAASLARYFTESDAASAFLIDFRAAPNWRHRWRMLRSRIFAPRDHILGKYPDQRHWPMPVLRARLLLQAAVRVAGRRLGK